MTTGLLRPLPAPCVSVCGQVQSCTCWGGRSHTREFRDDFNTEAVIEQSLRDYTHVPQALSRTEPMNLGLLIQGWQLDTS